MLRSGFLHLGVAALLGLSGSGCSPSARASSPAAAARDDAATTTVKRGSFVHRVRVSGTTEAVRASAAVVPRLSGQTSPTLVITKLVKGGSKVRPGDVLVEFDRQDQARAAFDRRAEFLDLEQQIKRQQADQAASRATDETNLKAAENDVARARLDVLKNRFLPAIDSEKNSLALEQALARFAQITKTFALRRRAADADRKILEIRRDRSRNALEHAERNAERMTLLAPFEGLAVVQPTFRGSQMSQIQEGDEVRAGVPVVKVVDPSSMRVRVRISQTDIAGVSVGEPARVSLDAYPGLEFDGRVDQVAPLAVPSSLTPVVRSFIAVVSIVGSHASLMPDLSAAVDIVVERSDNVLVVPREAVEIESGRVWVRVRQGDTLQRKAISVGPMSADSVVVKAGLEEGAVVARRALGGT
jgi:HlyD family secretion protein